jgi:polyisoprenoid-binding protein YceI
MRSITRKAIVLNVGIASALALLTACRAPEPKPTPAASTTLLEGTPPSVRTRYQVDSAASRLHVLVYRAGTMARLGHNHVLSTDQLSGTVVVHPQLEQSQLVLDLPVNSLKVDEPAARAVEGEDFAAAVPPDAREATRANLLREEVLDSVRFPVINLRLVSISGTHHRPVLHVSITVKGIAQRIEVPVALIYREKEVVAIGEFEVKQSAFGIAPFSVGMGALQVRDELRVRFSIIARP